MHIRANQQLVMYPSITTRLRWLYYSRKRPSWMLIHIPLSHMCHLIYSVQFIARCTIWCIAWSLWTSIGTSHSAHHSYWLIVYSSWSWWLVRQSAHPLVTYSRHTLVDAWHSPWMGLWCCEQVCESETHWEEYLKRAEEELKDKRSDIWFHFIFKITI